MVKKQKKERGGLKKLNWRDWYDGHANNDARGWLLLAGKLSG